MIEILMCTYNGERYLNEQLQSIVGQTLKPDVIKVFDDLSNDATVSIIESFMQKQPSVKWVLTVNENRKGWRKNFYDAITQSEGDIVFFADQDDIWKEDKIEIMSRALTQHNLLRLSGLQFLIDENGNRIYSSTIEQCKENYEMRLQYEDFADNIECFFWHNRIGCAMALSKELVNLIKYFEYDGIFAHDVWAVQLSSLLGRGAIIEYPCINYRVHLNNATANDKLEIKKVADIKKYIADRSFDSFEYFFDGASKCVLNKKQLRTLKGMREFLRLRKDLYDTKNARILIKLLKHLGRYPKLRTYFADIADTFGIR